MIKELFKDIKTYVSEKMNLPKYGYIHGYVADYGVPFGSGKTLTCVKLLNDICNRYHGKYVNGKLVIINIFTNIDLNLKGCVIKINSLTEFVEGIENSRIVENSNDVIHFNYLFIDEIGCEFNSRNFTKNFTPDFLAKLVTVRHYRASVLWTAQNYSLVDKIFRDLTTLVHTCRHLWRFYKVKVYLPSDMDLLVNNRYIKPLRKIKYFAKDELFGMYDTFASFEKLKTDVQEGSYSSVDDIYNRFVSESKIYKPKLRRKYKKR